MAIFDRVLTELKDGAVSAINKGTAEIKLPKVETEVGIEPKTVAIIGGMILAAYFLFIKKVKIF